MLLMFNVLQMWHKCGTCMYTVGMKKTCGPHVVFVTNVTVITFTAI